MTISQERLQQHAANCNAIVIDVTAPHITAMKVLQLWNDTMTAGYITTEDYAIGLQALQTAIALMELAR